MRERHSLGAELWNTLNQARSPLPNIFRSDKKWKSACTGICDLDEGWRRFVLFFARSIL